MKLKSEGHVILGIFIWIELFARAHCQNSQLSHVCAMVESHLAICGAVHPGMYTLLACLRQYLGYCIGKIINRYHWITHTHTWCVRYEGIVSRFDRCDRCCQFIQGSFLYIYILDFVSFTLFCVMCHQELSIFHSQLQVGSFVVNMAYFWYRFSGRAYFICFLLFFLFS